MSRTLWDRRNCEKTDVSIKTAEALSVNTFNVSCFSTQVILTVIWEEIIWVSGNNNWQSYRMSSGKNSWQAASIRKSAISCQMRWIFWFWEYLKVCWALESCSATWHLWNDKFCD